MEDLTRPSDMVSAMGTIKNQGEKLATALTELAKWQITISVEVVADTLDLKITARKGTKLGFISTIPKDKVLYFSQDPDALIDNILTEVYEKLLKEQLRNEHTEVLSKAIKNLTMIASRQ
jgi:hypothetical protein